jgi:hypothetical protein
MAVRTKVTNMSLTIGEGEEGTGLTFLPSLPVQRKRKRHSEKQSDEQSARRARSREEAR